MIQQITCGIKISVETNFEGTFYKGYKLLFAFGYKITIENQSKHLVQLESRFWEIFDALNDTTKEQGEGIIGKKPILAPEESYTYTSGCLLNSPFGILKGHYNMTNLDTRQSFKVIIPTFRLNALFALN